jgi:spore cortex biosynthesis protein YabQ
LHVDIAREVYVFLTMVLAGMSIGMVFDLFRLQRKFVKSGTVLVAIEDFLFWLIAFGIVAGSIGYFNSGELRFFEFLGLFLGCLLYFLVISERILWILEKLVRIILKILCYIFKIVLTPLLFLYKILVVPIVRVFKKRKKAKQEQQNAVEG